MEGYIGEIRMFGGNFAPKNWAFCSGQLLAIASNTALFSILGTTYGGDGKTTFALPDLRSRRAIHTGQGPGLYNHPLGQKGGAETHTLSVLEMPVHNHAVVGTVVIDAPIQCFNDVATVEEPGGTNYYAVNENIERFYNGTPNSIMMPSNVQTTDDIAFGNTGGGVPFDLLAPYTSLYYIICQYGIFPSRN